MRSDTSYERLFKLWVSLWNLVLENKRHLETVCASLQGLVFDEYSYPKYKNWVEICKVGEYNQHAMMALCTLDMSEDDEILHQIIAAFPQCFSDNKPVQGRLPFSFILKVGRDNAIKNHADPASGERYPYTYDAIPDFVPTQGFDYPGDGDPYFPPLPDGISNKVTQTEFVFLDDYKFIVLENNDRLGEIIIAPAECIALDL